MRQGRLYVMTNDYIIWRSGHSFFCEESGMYGIVINFGHKGTVLEEMPLLKKGNRRVPVSDSLQVRCRAENVFFIPVLKKKKKRVSFKPLLIWNNGGINLPKDKNDKNFMPSKYRQYIKATHPAVSLW